MRLYESVFRPLAFRLDPETVHNLAMRLIATGLVRVPPIIDNRLRQRLFGVDFQNPLGLAAGFDKNAVAAGYWHRLGFGFAELGTLTFHSQSGNERPRLFRLPEHQALINRMGFNNDGASAAADRLKRANPQIPIGINLGKSRVTELERAPEDYRQSFRILRSLGAYFVVNVSSPNTPGLRELQEKGALLEIVQAIREVDPAVPLFVKVSPDLESGALDDIVHVAHEAKLTGLIATNTTLSREGIVSTQSGGLSGAPLRERANQVLAHLYRGCDRELVLIASGGVFRGEDLYTKIGLGAHLVQMYTGWVYGGPAAVPAALRDLLARFEREGISHLSKLRGSLA